MGNNFLLSYFLNLLPRIIVIFLLTFFICWFAFIYNKKKSKKQIEDASLPIIIVLLLLYFFVPDLFHRSEIIFFIFIAVSSMMSIILSKHNFYLVIHFLFLPFFVFLSLVMEDGLYVLPYTILWTIIITVIIWILYFIKDIDGLLVGYVIINSILMLPGVKVKLEFDTQFKFTLIFSAVLMGLLLWNRKPARIKIGPYGSDLISFIFASFIFRLSNYCNVSMKFFPIILVLPAIDVIYSVINSIKTKKWVTLSDLLIKNADVGRKFISAMYIIQTFLVLLWLKYTV